MQAIWVALPVGSSTHDWGARQIGRTGEPPRHLALGQAAPTGIELPVPIEATDAATLQHLESCLAAFPLASRFSGAGSDVFVWGHHSTVA
jgi:hypothetical protein